MEQTTTILSAIVVMLVIEPLAVGWRECSFRRLCHPSRSEMTDLAIFLISVTGLGAFWTLGLGALGADLWLPRFYGHLGLQFSTGDVFTGAVAFAVVYGLADYWSHRFWHADPFWNIHRLHHSATTLSPLLVTRFSPIEVLFMPVTFSAIIGLIVVPPVVVLIGLCLHLAHVALIHSSLPWTFGWVGRWIILSPAGHRLHHSIATEHTDKNFSVTPLWDHLFGTYCEPIAQPIPVGIREQAHNQRFFLLEIASDAWRLVCYPVHARRTAER